MVLSQTILSIPNSASLIWTQVIGYAGGGYLLGPVPGCGGAQPQNRVDFHIEFIEFRSEFGQ